ncbi:contact-dependent growth inhibition system immunity protein [Nocardiopsis sp. MG754419]|uniref:contact-dependent growth inhibition system immunity protein n=1 Tax=Nocardiopsis sp. MG754419 TaxID=2259865 RepID=UPI001BA9CC0C|nr:contact-dependent growth inhibition system immunity protein [Nocardiopsis sp. MG754419]MBR8744837.1 hypothetical protein [Nocardiopsis sp. MG754419]
MNFESTNLSEARLFFNNYLHQDWDIDGSTLEEVFDNNDGLGSLKEGLRRGSQELIDSDCSDRELAQLFLGDWTSGYEPEHGGYDNWRDVLREIIRLCDKYMELEK